MLFFALSVLRGILPRVYLTHLALLMAALYVLSSDSITSADLQHAREWLLAFYKDFSELYGESSSSIYILLQIDTELLVQCQVQVEK